jgi:hypothetical protein
VIALVYLPVAGQPQDVADLLLVVLDGRDVVAVDAEVLACLRRQAGKSRARAHQKRCIAHRPGGQDEHLALDLELAPGGLAGRIVTVVVDLGDGQQVPVGPRGALGDQLRL